MIGTVKFEQMGKGEKKVFVEPKKSKGAEIGVGSEVMGTILRVEPFFVSVRIEGSRDRPLSFPLKGTIKKEHVRDFDIDAVDMHESFAPGDIIVAKVLKIAGLASKEWLLSTADKEHGVVFAESQLSGDLMVPKSWNTFQCAKTRTKELRKVAKP